VPRYRGYRETPPGNAFTVTVPRAVTCGAMVLSAWSSRGLAGRELLKNVLSAYTVNR
jgi:hypothetical protein